jgi:hypothetical protein
VCGVVVVAAVAGAIVLANVAYRPDCVWTLRAPGAPGHLSMTAHVLPGGDALPGRWLTTREQDGTLRLVHLERRPEGIDGALRRLVEGGVESYVPTGTSAVLGGAVWYQWSPR